MRIYDGDGVLTIFRLCIDATSSCLGGGFCRGFTDQEKK